MITILILLVAVALFLYYHLYHKRKGLPPGPIPIPFFGNILELALEGTGENTHVKWHKKYGPLHTVWYGEFAMIHVTDYDLLHDLYVKNSDAYVGRGYCVPECLEFWNDVRSLDGLICNEGDSWQETRKFTLKTLRHFGMGSSLMEERILNETAILLKKINTNIKAGIVAQNFSVMVDVTMASVIYSIITGVTFTEKNMNVFETLKYCSHQHLSTATHPMNMIQQKNCKYYRYLPGFKYYYNEVKRTWADLVNFFDEEIREHKEKFAKVTNVSTYKPNDLIYSFLQQRRLKDEAGEKHYFTDANLQVTCVDLWMAGQDTISATMGWAIIYVIHWPECQAKAHEELDRVIGSNRLVTMSDKKKLPYVNAVINEIQRLASVLPNNLLRRTTRAVRIGGYTFPKGTPFIPEISAVMNNDERFKNPKTFDPSRFLDEHGQLKHVDELMPFGMGKRMCVGESLARMELFILIANLLNQYRFLFPKDKMPSLKRNFGVIAGFDSYLTEIQRRYPD